MGAGRERGIQKAMSVPSLLRSSPLTDVAHAQVRRIERIHYAATAARRQAESYEQVLGFARESELNPADPATAGMSGFVLVHVKTITLGRGDDRIDLIQYLDLPEGRLWPVGSRSQDRWFKHFVIVIFDMGQVYTRLPAFASRAISRDRPQILLSSMGPVTVFKFRDPDADPLEQLRPPPAAGRPAWQYPAGQEMAWIG